MKTSYKLASVALLGALGVGLAVASETKAGSPSSATGDGKIVFTNKITPLTSGDPILPPDTTNPKIKPTTGIVTGDGERQFEFISPLDFDTRNIVSTPNNKTYNVLTYTAPKADEPGNFTMPNFVRFRDLRADAGVENHYEIAAELTSQFAQAGGVATLDGASLTYNKVQMGSSENPATKPEPAMTGVTLPTTFNLALNTPIVVLKNEEANVGYGRHEIMFGSYADVIAAGGEGKEYDGVVLNVPGNVLLKKGQYNAVVTWTIRDAA